MPLSPITSVFGSLETSVYALVPQCCLHGRLVKLALAYKPEDEVIQVASA